MPIVNILSGANTRIDINDSKITVTSSDQTYSGSTNYAILAITVKYDGTTLVGGVDYDLSGTTTATDAGTYSVTITGIGKYKGTRSQNWTINKQTISFIYTVQVNGSTWGTGSSNKKKISATGSSNGITFKINATSNPSGYTPKTYTYTSSNTTYVGITNGSVSGGIATATVYFKTADTSGSSRAFNFRVNAVTQTIDSNYQLSASYQPRYVYYSTT